MKVELFTDTYGQDSGQTTSIPTLAVNDDCNTLYVIALVPIHGYIHLHGHGWIHMGSINSIN